MIAPRKVALAALTHVPLTVAALAVGIALLAPDAADARVRAARSPAGSYDGTWNVVFSTTAGGCGSGYSVPFMVSGGRVLSAGGGRVSGRVTRSGAVAVNVEVGATHASGGGRLSSYSGGGSWSGVIQGANCSGTWQATRG